MTGQLPLPDTRWPPRLEWSPDGHWLAVINRRTTGPNYLDYREDLYVWDGRSDPLDLSDPDASGLDVSAWNPDASLLAVGQYSEATGHQVALWETTAWRVVARVPDLARPRFSPDGSRLVLHDYATGRPRLVLMGIVTDEGTTTPTPTAVPPVIGTRTATPTRKLTAVPTASATRPGGSPQYRPWMPLLLYGSLPEPASFRLEVIPARITNSIPGQRCVFLVRLIDGAPPHDGGPVTLLAWTTGGTTSVEPAAITAERGGEVTLIPDPASVERTLTLSIRGQRGAETELVEASLDVLADMPGRDDDLGIRAAEIRDRFVPWLAENHPELGITADTEWRGTVVTPQILVVMHYLFFSADWEMHVAWHIMISPYDWTRIDLRRRFSETRPSRAFEISSWSNATEPIEIEPPESMWR